MDFNITYTRIELVAEADLPTKLASLNTDNAVIKSIEPSE